MSSKEVEAALAEAESLIGDSLTSRRFKCLAAEIRRYQARDEKIRDALRDIDQKEQG